MKPGQFNEHQLALTASRVIWTTYFFVQDLTFSIFFSRCNNLTPTLICSTCAKLHQLQNILLNDATSCNACFFLIRLVTWIIIFKIALYAFRLHLGGIKIIHPQEQSSLAMDSPSDNRLAYNVILPLETKMIARYLLLKSHAYLYIKNCIR